MLQIQIFSGAKVILLFLLTTAAYTFISFYSLSLRVSANQKVLKTHITVQAEPGAIAEQSVHFVFTTSCDSYQAWQSVLLLWSAANLGYSKSQEIVEITRIVSGCNMIRKAQLREDADLYQYDAIKYNLHFTPVFANSSSFKFYNKPLGIQHWLSTRYGDYENKSRQEDVVVIILDPDMLMLDTAYETKKVDSKSSNVLCTVFCSETNRSRYRNPQVDIAFMGNQVKRTQKFQGKSIIDISNRVREGSPVAQLYGLGAEWIKTKDIDAVCSQSDNCKTIKQSEVFRKYSVGPPYFLHVNDLKAVAPKWTKFMTPMVQATKGDVLADMYAYVLAAIEADLPHVVLDHFMVSNIEVSGEAWPWVDKVLSRSSCSNPLEAFNGTNIPTFAHLNQKYTASDNTDKMWTYYKMSVPRNIMTCKVPLLKAPPENLIYTQHTLNEKRNAWMICTAIKYTNEAIQNYKLKKCDSLELNLKKSVVLGLSRNICKDSTRSTCWSYARVEDEE